MLLVNLQTAGEHVQLGRSVDIISPVTSGLAKFLFIRWSACTSMWPLKHLVHSADTWRSRVLTLGSILDGGRRALDHVSSQKLRLRAFPHLSCP